MVSIYILAKSGAGVATVGGITIWQVCWTWHTVGQKTVPMFGCFAKIEVEQIKKIS